MYSIRKTRILGVEWVEILQGESVIAQAPSEYGANVIISNLSRKTKANHASVNVIDYSKLD